jgi:hypothetical protein
MLRARPAGRLALLAGTIDHDPLSTADASAWTAPRDIGSLEWFSSPTDMCHVYAALAALAREPARPLTSATADVPYGATG